MVFTWHKLLFTICGAVVILGGGLLFFHAKRPHLLPVRYAVLAIVSEEAAEVLSPGQVLTDAAGKQKAGRILSLETAPALSEDSMTGECKEKPGQVRLTLTLEAEATERNGLFRLATTPLAPGCRLYLHGKAALEGICLWVRPVQKVTA